MAVWRSVRMHGDTKTERSRRTLALPAAAVQALHAWSGSQADERLAAGDDWQDTGLVFTTHHGAALDAANVRKMFKRVATAAGIGDGWTPRELRTSFVSLLSHHGVSIEEIARLVGHASTRTTEVVYRRELRSVITTGAEIMDQLIRKLDPVPAGNHELAQASRRSLVIDRISFPDGKPWPSSRSRRPSRNVTIRGRHQSHIDSALVGTASHGRPCLRISPITASISSSRAGPASMIAEESPETEESA
jgi:Phage integrase family